MENIINLSMDKAISQNFIDYAMSVISDRALVDVRDGLKPVQRRILYDAFELGLNPDKPYKKAARVVGDVLGKYHPHGDLSVYEAMVKMAQDFTLRYPMIDGHGNWGSVDGDGAAAMRYTEAKLTRYGKALMDDIRKNTVNFIPNFDGEEQEPTILPTLIPNTLVNGTMGIAVGMASNMPSHNLNDIYDALNYIIDCTAEGVAPDEDRVIEIVKAPDFPTGGIITNAEALKEAYKTGKGKVIVRGKVEIEEDGTIIISEIPYKINKAKLVEKMFMLSKITRQKGKPDKPAIIPEIKEVRDETNKDGMRIVIELKKDSNPVLVVNKLYKYTDLQSNFSINNIVLDETGQPQQVNLLTMLTSFLSHSANIILKRTQYDIEKGSARHNIVIGILKCCEDDMIEQVISAIRSSDDAIIALTELGFNQAQAEYIADMKIKALSNSSRIKLVKEKEELETNLSKWNDILNNQLVLLEEMKYEYSEIRSKFADERRTEIAMDLSNINEEDLIKDETLIITITDQGLIKSVEENEYTSQKRGGKGSKAATTKDDEIIQYMFTTNSKDNIMFFTNRGRVHLLKAYKIPKGSRNARGRSIFNFLNLDTENGEDIVNVIAADTNDTSRSILLATRNGILKRLQLDNLSTRMSVTKVIEFKEGDSLMAVQLVSEGDEIILNSASGMSIRTKITEDTIRPMGRAASGVKGMKFKKENDYLVDMSLCNKEFIFTLTESGLGKKTLLSEYTAQRRGGSGLTAHKITDKTGQIIAASTVNNDDDIFIVTAQGLMIRIKAECVSETGRNTAGVKLLTLNNGDVIAGISVSNFNNQDENFNIEEDESKEE